MSLSINFWGVRGSKPTPNKDTRLFGGNTACVEVVAGNRTLILDGGTGLAELGHKMKLNKGEKTADIFFSHLHWDHIQGIPFFQPLYKAGNSFRLYGEDKNPLTFKEIITKQMSPPYFPITMGMMQADYEFISIKADDVINLGEGIIIKTFALNHPGGCLAYRIEKGDYAIVYATDTQPILGARNNDFIKFVAGADVFIYDTHFTEAEYRGEIDGESKESWGHSTWEEGINISQNAEVGYYVLFHYKEDRTDAEQAKIEKQAQREYPKTVAAREGMNIIIGGDYPEKVVINYPY